MYILIYFEYIYIKYAANIGKYVANSQYISILLVIIIQ
jgi:hypothetical protein